MTTSIESVNTPAVNDAPAKPVLKSNKDIRSYMVSSALDFAAIREEAKATAQAANPELKLEEASRRAAMGIIGMKADTHMRCNGLLSGLTDADMRVLRMFGFDLSRLPKDKDSGGFTREEKYYIMTICACIAQNKRPDSLDFTAMNEALAKLDPKAPRKQKGANSINILINMLQDVTSWTVGGFMNEAGHDGDTQAGNIANLIGRIELGKLEKQGTKRSWKVTPDQDHPIIKALIAIK